MERLTATWHLVGTARNLQGHSVDLELHGAKLRSLPTSRTPTTGPTFARQRWLQHCGKPTAVRRRGCGKRQHFSLNLLAQFPAQSEQLRGAYHTPASHSADGLLARVDLTDNRMWRTRPATRQTPKAEAHYAEKALRMEPDEANITVGLPQINVFAPHPRCSRGTFPTGQNT